METQQSHYTSTKQAWMSLCHQWNIRDPRRRRILYVNEKDQVPLTVIIVAPRGPDWTAEWSPAGLVKGMDSVPVLMPNPNCTMPDDMAHLSAICLRAEVKRDRALLAKWQTAQYITHQLGDSLLGCKGPNLCRALFNWHSYGVMPLCHPQTQRGENWI